MSEQNETPAPRAPLPPFTPTTAALKARAAENAWNSRNPVLVSQAYTPNTRWRNRSEFINGRSEVVQFLQRKWKKEENYKLVKEVWASEGNRIAVRFVYEWRDSDDKWWRSFGNENWMFDTLGYMEERWASINDVEIEESERKLKWEGDKRPEDWPSLSEMGL